MTTILFKFPHMPNGCKVQSLRQQCSHYAYQLERHLCNLYSSSPSSSQLSFSFLIRSAKSSGLKIELPGSLALGTFVNPLSLSKTFPMLSIHFLLLSINVFVISPMPGRAIPVLPPPTKW